MDSPISPTSSDMCNSVTDSSLTLNLLRSSRWFSGRMETTNTDFVKVAAGREE